MHIEGNITPFLILLLQGPVSAKLDTQHLYVCRILHIAVTSYWRERSYVSVDSVHILNAHHLWSMLYWTHLSVVAERYYCPASTCKVCRMHIKALCNVALFHKWTVEIVSMTPLHRIAIALWRHRHSYPSAQHSTFRNVWPVNIQT